MFKDISLDQFHPVYNDHILDTDHTGKMEYIPDKANSYNDCYKKLDILEPLGTANFHHNRSTIDIHNGT